MYVQRYSLPVDKLRIADFTDLSADDFITAVFSHAEECEVNGYTKPGYTFSQVVGRLVSEKFSGMRVPGVHGERAHRYSNIVVFRPEPDWRKWVESDSAPFRLS